MHTDQMREMVDRYLTGTATPREKEAIEKWLQARKEDDQPLETPHQQAVEASLWQSIARQTIGTPVPAAPQAGMHRMFPYRKWIGYAAAALVLLVGGIWFMTTRQQQPSIAHTYTAPPGTYTTEVLPDSSIAHLFPGTTLTVTSDFNQHDRKVNITGRVFFEVKHNPAHPFYVQAGELMTRVLGTSFEVMAQDSLLASVIVRTGKVGVQYGQQYLSALAPGKRLQYDVQQHHFTIDEVNAALVCEWWNNGMVFHQTPLPEVLQQLSRWYNVPIAITNPKWEQETVTIRIKGQSFNEALSLLSESLGFQYRKANNKIIIY